MNTWPGRRGPWFSYGRRGQRRRRAVGRVVDHGRLAGPVEPPVDRRCGGLGRAVLDVDDRRRGVLRVLQGALEQPVVAVRELERLELALGKVGGTCALAPGVARREGREEADVLQRQLTRRVERHPLSARLERVGDDAPAVVLVVGRVAGRGVQHVCDRARAAGQDHRVTRLLDARQDPVGDIEEVALDADVRRRQRDPARDLYAPGAHMK